MFTALASTLSASVRRTGAGVAGPEYGSRGGELSWTFCASVRLRTRMPPAWPAGNGVGTGAAAGGEPWAGVLAGGRGAAGEASGVWRSGRKAAEGAGVAADG